MSHQSEPEHEPAWIHGHAHEPNPAPPDEDAGFDLIWPGNRERLTPNDLGSLPQTTVSGCYIVSTGHGVSGPFVFGGVRLVDFLQAYMPPDAKWETLDVVSGDGFGNRIAAHEVIEPAERPILLATHIDGIAMPRSAGLVRLIVPDETDDALRQVKWIARIEVLPL